MLVESYQFIPYYSEYTSVVWSGGIGTLFWITINALILKLAHGVNGHIIIILIGLPFFFGIQRSLRFKRVTDLMISSTQSLRKESDVLIQLSKVHELSERNLNSIMSHSQDNLIFIGFINYHVQECQTLDCPCKSHRDLYDIQSQEYSTRLQNFHQDPIFIKHLIKKLYEQSLDRFPHSADLHIAFAFYLLSAVKNKHVALAELNRVDAKRATLKQQFTIIRYKYFIESELRFDNKHSKDQMHHLKNVIKFELIFEKMNKKIG